MFLYKNLTLSCYVPLQQRYKFPKNEKIWEIWRNIIDISFALSCAKICCGISDAITISIIDRNLQTWFPVLFPWSLRVFARSSFVIIRTFLLLLRNFAICEFTDWKTLLFASAFDFSFSRSTYACSCVALYFSINWWESNVPPSPNSPLNSSRVSWLRCGSPWMALQAC